MVCPFKRKGRKDDREGKTMCVRESRRESSRGRKRVNRREGEKSEKIEERERERVRESGGLQREITITNNLFRPMVQ